MSAKTPLQKVQELAQDALSRAPVIILGSGASAAHGIPGMWPLGQQLLALTPSPSWSLEETSEWDKFRDAVRADKDLETALGMARLTDEQMNRIVFSTRDLLLPADHQAFLSLLANRRLLPLTRLYRYLFTSTHKTINIVTPNYDRLAEYAADAAGIGCFTGFTHGHLQVRAKERPRTGQVGDLERTVCVWKVHGSLDWFQDAHGQIIAARTLREPPPDHIPLMVTPGIDKYRLTHKEPFRTIFNRSDEALGEARAYFCVGYGFNDEHVQAKLVERCESTVIPIVMITKLLSPAAKSFLAGGRCRRYLAIEEMDGGSRAYTHECPSSIDLYGYHIWQFKDFLNLVIGDDA